MRRLPATLPAVPVVALLIFAGVPLTASASGPATSVRTVKPVDDSGQLKAGYKVIRRLGHGTCQSGSFMTGVADRCSTPETHGSVLDPCWPTATATTYICQAKPWRHKVVRVHTGQPASGGPGAHRQRLPWGMRIGARVRCLLDPGSVRRLSGHPLLFHCTRHRDVFGPLRRSGSHWHAHVYRTGAHTRSGYRSLGWQPVRIAWYGAAPGPAPSPSPSGIPTLLPTASDPMSPTASP